MCSRSLHEIDVRETGLWFSAKCLSPFLKTGLMFASFQSAGSEPVSIETVAEIWY